MKLDRQFGQSRILVVDQDFLLADSIALAIQLTGRWAEARSKLSVRLLPSGFDILIVNPLLDELSAIDLARLRQHRPSMKIVFLLEDINNELPAGITLKDVDGVLTKSMSAEALLVLVNMLEGVDLLRSGLAQ